MSTAAGAPIAGLISALARLYRVRMELVQLESLEVQETLASGRLVTEGPIPALSRYPLRSLVVALSVVGLTFVGADLWLGYWRVQTAIVGALALTLGVIGMAMFSHDRRVAMISERFQGELRTAARIKAEVNETIHELEIILEDGETPRDASAGMPRG